METLLQEFNSLTPLGIIGLLAYIVYLLVKNKKDVKTISVNHLSVLPEIHETLKRMEGKLDNMNDNITYIKARTNGKNNS